MDRPAETDTPLMRGSMQSLNFALKYPPYRIPGKEGTCQPLLVVGFVSDYLETPVDLFQEDYPHHLMREGHR